MARPNTDISIHRYFFEIQKMKVKEAMSALLKKDSLNDGDIQAAKGLVEVYDALAHVDAYMAEVNRLRENGARRQEEYSSDCHQEQQSWMKGASSSTA